ncbi:MAG: glycosyltransferase family 4 protein [Deltaproteobacteria bacterium]|nr:glycosyltransferase family 4 protein [Deltaproteobacteria bacterium]MBI3391498.1 glycosyltransferase family 4 protein [Deltaproteobacteria bacterium]
MRHLLILNERDIRHPNAGGAEVNLFEVTRRLVAKGYRATLLCTRVAGAPAEEVIDAIRIVRMGNRFTYYLRLPTQVRRLLTPDTVIIEHLCKLPFCSPVYARAPVLPITHHLFGTTAFRQVPWAVAAVVVASEWLIPYVYRDREFIAVSPSTKLDLIARGIRRERIRIVPNGVDCARFHPPAREPDGPPTLLCLGRVEPYKRIDLILRAFAQVRAQIPDVQLIIVGGGTGLAAVRGDVQQLGLNASVTCTGFVSEGEKISAMHTAHLVLNASEKEGWGLTVVEAGACGIPTVAGNVPGLRDAVVDGHTGILIPHGDVAALARVTVDVLRDHTRRRQLGRAARRWAERFSWDGVADATAQCIEEIAGGEPQGERMTWFENDSAVASGG